MIAKGERKFLPLSLLCLLPQDLLYSLKKSRFVEQLLFYLKNEVSIVSQNMEPLSLPLTSRGVLNVRVMMNMPAIRLFFPHAGN